MKPKWKAIGIQLVILFVIFKIWSAYPVQDFIVRLIPIANDFFDPYTARMPNWLLVQYLKDGNFYLRGSALQELCNRGERASAYYETVKKIVSNPRQDVRRGVYSLLKCLNKQKAIGFYFEELNRLTKDSLEYRQCLGILHNYKPPQLLPYLLEYAGRPDGWKNASCVYLEEYGNPAGLPVLYDQKKQAEAEKAAGNWQGKMELKRINKAIVTLEGIKAQQENKNRLQFH